MVNILFFSQFWRDAKQGPGIAAKPPLASASGGRMPPKHYIIIAL